MQNIFIRVAENSDAALIAEVSRKTFFDTFAVFNTKEDMDLFMDQQFSTATLMSQVGDAGNVFFLAFVDGEIAGYVYLRKGEQQSAIGTQPSIEIARIYALQSFIGKGVGSALLTTCIDYARKQNNEIIWLGVWEKNLPAIQFYNKWGFEKFGEHPFILGNDIQQDWLLKISIQ